MIGYDQAPRYAELIRRIWGEDSEILPPGLILELDRPEWRLFKRELDWVTGRLTIAASPGNFGRFQIQNPAGSGRIVVVTNVITFLTAAGAVHVTIDAALLGGAVPNLALDTRLPFAPGPGAPQVASLNAISNAAGGVGGYRYGEYSSAAATVWTRFDLPRPPVIAPGHNLTIWDQTVNEAFTAYLYGYERPAEPEELVP